VLVGATCSGCGGELIFTTKRRRRFKAEQLRCPSCLTPADSPQPYTRFERSLIAQLLLLSASKAKRALDPDEPDSNEERVARLYEVINDLHELSIQLAPGEEPEPPTP
jgi:hypothetical protein